MEDIVRVEIGPPDPPRFKTRILGISSGEPFGSRTWSGSSLGVFGALRSLGYVDHAIDAGVTRRETVIAQALEFRTNRERWKARFQSSVWPVRFSSRRARLEVANLTADYDAVLQLGPYLARSEKPVVSYLDDEISAALSLRRVTHADTRSRLEFEGKIYKTMDRIFTMSAWAADAMASFHAIPRERIEVVGAGSNINEELLAGERDYSNVNFLFVGRDFKRKGGPEVLEAFARLRQSIPAARLTIVGFGPAGLIAPGVTSTGLISLAGQEGKRRMADLYRSASAFVMPSVYEPFGIAFIEAMAAGLPCIGADRCAMPEIIGDGGLVVPAGDVSALARAMSEISSDPSVAADFGMRGRNAYRARFGWSRVAKKIANAVDALTMTNGLASPDERRDGPRRIGA